MYEVYATAWNDPRLREELIPARDLEFSMPLSAHGECTFTATVEPGKSFWRASISAGISGVLIARDGVPVWQGWVVSENQSGPRSFQFRAVEWGAFFERTPAVAKAYGSWYDTDLFQDVISLAQAVNGQDAKIQLGQPRGASISDYTINSWDRKSVAAVFTEIATQEGGPEWYFGTTGTLTNPVRQLQLGDRLGHLTPQVMLEFVESTEDYVAPGATPGRTVGRRGGNVIACARTRDSSRSATRAIAVGAGEERAQLSATASSARLLAAGWPLLTRTETYSDVSKASTLARHAAADLAASAGLATGYALTTWDREPDWFTIPRGSTVAVSLDTDVYATERPYQFNTRVLNMTVRVPDAGQAQVQWDVAEVLET